MGIDKTIMNSAMVRTRISKHRFIERMLFNNKGKLKVTIIFSSVLRDRMEKNHK